MEDIRKLAQEIADKHHSEECWFTKEELTEDYTEQMEENDAESLLKYLELENDTELYKKVQSHLGK
jgi:hypothetical protein